MFWVSPALRIVDCVLVRCMGVAVMPFLTVSYSCPALLRLAQYASCSIAHHEMMPPKRKYLDAHIASLVYDFVISTQNHIWRFSQRFYGELVVLWNVRGQVVLYPTTSPLASYSLCSLIASRSLSPKQKSTPQKYNILDPRTTSEVLLGQEL